MRMFWLGFLALCLAVPAAGAQEEGEEAFPTVGLGPKGRFTQAQAQILALRAVPGEVTRFDEEWENGNFLFEYTIQVRDGSIYEVEVDAATGKIYEIEIEDLAPRAVLPHKLVSQDMVKAFALDYVFTKTRGKRKPQLISADIAVFQRKPVYKIIVKKALQRYELIYDAEDGDFIKMQEAE